MTNRRAKAATESGADTLHRIAELNGRHPECELAQAVAAVRADGRGWAPIVVLPVTNSDAAR